MTETYHERGKTVHGFRVREHPLYFTWAGMKSRCNDENTPGYPLYGGRGITYCDRWKHFENFAEDLYPQYREGLSLDRINVNGNYELENCRWADRTVQCLNRRVFKNASSPYAGINKKNGYYLARYGEYGKRYNLGRFDTAEEARDYRADFISLLMVDREAAMSMTDRRVRRDSSVGIKGICFSEKTGKYTVRITVAGKRITLCQTISLDKAKKALEDGRKKYQG